MLRGRVCGSLAVARALGDHSFKNATKPQPHQMVSPEPDVYYIDRNPAQDEFIVIACDGVYDVMSNEAVANFVRESLRHFKSLAVVASQLVDQALQRGSTDNISVIIIAFVDGSLQHHARAPPPSVHSPTRLSLNLSRNGPLPRSFGLSQHPANRQRHTAKPMPPQSIPSLNLPVALPPLSATSSQSARILDGAALVHDLFGLQHKSEVVRGMHGANGADPATLNEEGQGSSEDSENDTSDDGTDDMLVGEPLVRSITLSPI